MAPEQKTITPKTAAAMLAKTHHRQRKINLSRVRLYSRAMGEGEWIDFHPDMILVEPDDGSLCGCCTPPQPRGGVFNGRHRLTSIVDSGVTIKAWVDEEADASALFSHIDGQFGRAAHQFIPGTRAAMRSAAARIILWYDHFHFDRPLGNLHGYWAMNEVLEASQSYDDIFDRMMKLATQNYDNTGLSPSAVLAVLTLACREGYEDEAVAFAEHIANPEEATPDEPAWYLYTRMMKRHHRDRKRHTQQDVAIYMRCLNANITGDELPVHMYAGSLVPNIGDTEKEFRRRLARANEAKSRANKKG